MKHFNNLTPAEAERLAMLAEEAGEIVQIIGKILKHGYESHHPNKPEETNRKLLETEIGDLFGIVDEMKTNQDLIHWRIEQSRIKKWEKALKYAHHQNME